MQCFINPSQHVVPTNVVRRGGSVVHVHGHVEDRRRTGDGERKGFKPPVQKRDDVTLRHQL